MAGNRPTTPYFVDIIDPTGERTDQAAPWMPVRIAAYSRRQAMDWSLVLVSQGIEAIIEAPQEGTNWGLWVAPEHLGKAHEAIRQYRLENRHRPWRQHTFGPGLVFDWACLAWVALILAFYAMDAHKDLRAIGMVDSGLVRGGQWWRLFTAIWLHADLAHLGTNAAIGLIFIGLAMGRYGTGAGLLAAYLGGLGGNLLSCLVDQENHRSLGASGMVMAGLGLLAVQSVGLWRQSPYARKYVLGGLAAGVMLFVLLALTPGTDVVAHAGGFLSGLILGAGLLAAPSVGRTSWGNLLCGLVFLLLVVLPWALAFRG